LYFKTPPDNSNAQWGLEDSPTPRPREGRLYGQARTWDLEQICLSVLILDLAADLGKLNKLL
jgi:hypothetical protein